MKVLERFEAQATTLPRPVPQGLALWAL